MLDFNDFEINNRMKTELLIIFWTSKMRRTSCYNSVCVFVLPNFI